MKYTCGHCGHETENPERDPEVVRDRGYYWHTKCARMLDSRTVDFPSEGKMLPGTIMTPDA